MTTPTGQISLADVRLEIWGDANGQIDITQTEVRDLAGAGAGQVSTDALKGKTWTSPSWNRAAGSSTVSGSGTASFTITTGGKNCAWGFTTSGPNGGSINTTVASGGYTTSFTGSLTAGGISDRSGTITLTCYYGKFTRNWTITLQAEGSGGGSTVTL